ncbi:hypothetical protein [Amycolatopsis sp. NBC_00438]|uniref:hypothetical protein n=1 Tax=Amycolatopsis sp. NBC_00438 TaxID=2903558 RepID=UPI002E221DA2
MKNDQTRPPSVSTMFIRPPARGCRARAASSCRSSPARPRAVVDDFYFALHGESRKTPYPADEIAQLLGSL